jgi:Ca2+-binding EF-hand superfamily protein
MMQGIGGHGAPDASQIRNLFRKIDTDSDGKVTRSEFVAGAPDKDSNKAGQLFDALDSQGAGALSENDLLTAFERLSSQMQKTLVRHQEEQNGPPDPSKLFSKLDADGDGNVTREEFVAGRPDHVSEKEAGKLFDKLDKEGSGSLSQSQFETALKEAGPPPPPPGMAAGAPPADGKGGSNSNQVFDELDTNKDGKVSMSEWLAGKPAEVSEEDATAMFEAMDTEGTGSLTKEQLAEGMEKNRPESSTATSTAGNNLVLDNKLLTMLLEAVKSYEKASLKSFASSTTTVAA